MPLSGCRAALLTAWICASGLLRDGVQLARAASFQGDLPAEPFFATYVGKFCFDYRNSTEETVGNIELLVTRETVTADPTLGKLYFMIFDDEKKHWKKARRRWDSSTCEEKIEDASLITELNIHTHETEFKSLIHIREHVRPRFWYFSFVACGIGKDASLKYQVHTTNILSSWEQEFSLDHMGLAMTYAVFTAAFLLTTLSTVWASRWRSAVQEPLLRDHPYLQLLLLSYVASLASCLLFLCHYALFMVNGFGSMRIRFMAVLAARVADCTIFLIAILASVGWAISRPLLPHREWFLGTVTLVGGLTTLCELHAETTIDQSTKLYSYQSGPGVASLILKIFMFCWFAYQTKATYDEELEERRRRFYKVLGIAFSGWFINVPVTVLLAFALSPWCRYKVVTRVDIVARFLGQALLSQLFCGPLSPITALNTFPAMDDGPGRETSFDKLDDGYHF